MDNSWTPKLIIFQVDSAAVWADTVFTLYSHIRKSMELCWSGAEDVDKTSSSSRGTLTEMEICFHIHWVYPESNIGEEKRTLIINI